MRTQVQPIVPICVGDNLEIAVNLYSLRGLVDIESITWINPIFSDIPSENTMSYKRGKKMQEEEDKSAKIVADLSRVCELEDTQLEWRYSEYYSFPSNNLKFIEDIKPLFTVEKIDFANVDIIAIRGQLTAKKKGYLPCNEVLGIGVKVVSDKEECTNEVKRAGLIIDRHCNLELRINDVLIVYSSKFNSDIKM